MHSILYNPSGKHLMCAHTSQWSGASHVAAHFSPAFLSTAPYLHLWDIAAVNRSLGSASTQQPWMMRLSGGFPDGNGMEWFVDAKDKQTLGSWALNSSPWPYAFICFCPFWIRRMDIELFETARQPTWTLGMHCNGFQPAMELIANMCQPFIKLTQVWSKMEPSQIVASVHRFCWRSWSCFNFNHPSMWIRQWKTGTFFFPRGTFPCYLLHFGAKTSTLLNLVAKICRLHCSSFFQWF